MAIDVTDRARNIRLLALDVDGVLTDGKLYFSSDGTEAKAFNTLDGHGIKLLRRSGIEVAIISGRQSEPVERRARELGISHLIQGREDKLTALNELLHIQAFELETIAFMGDDYPDLTIMRHVGLALTVAGALPAVAEHAHWQSRFRGGEGAVREACDMIMRAQGTFDAALDHYLRQSP